MISYDQMRSKLHDGKSHTILYSKLSNGELKEYRVKLDNKTPRKRTQQKVAPNKSESYQKAALRTFTLLPDRTKQTFHLRLICKIDHQTVV